MSYSGHTINKFSNEAHYIYRDDILITKPDIYLWITPEDLKQNHIKVQLISKRQQKKFYGISDMECRNNTVRMRPYTMVHADFIVYKASFYRSVFIIYVRSDRDSFASTDLAGRLEVSEVSPVQENITYVASKR